MLPDCFERVVELCRVTCVCVSNKGQLIFGTRWDQPPSHSCVPQRRVRLRDERALPLTPDGRPQTFRPGAKSVSSSLLSLSPTTHPPPLFPRDAALPAPPARCPTTGFFLPQTRGRRQRQEVGRNFRRAGGRKRMMRGGLEMCFGVSSNRCRNIGASKHRYLSQVLPSRLAKTDLSCCLQVPSHCRARVTHLHLRPTSRRDPSDPDLAATLQPCITVFDLPDARAMCDDAWDESRACEVARCTTMKEIARD